jgi:hypothetical protein
MSELLTKALGERIAALIDRVKILAAERDAVQRENRELHSRLETHEREQVRLRSVLDEEVRELRQG